MKRRTNDTPVPGRHLHGKHTPGPWTADKCQDANGNWTIRKADGTENGNTESEPIATVYNEDDASLISAAPELLAIVRAFALTDPHGPLARACQQAILKTGGTAP